jgi:hypothetical protein
MCSAQPFVYHLSQQLDSTAKHQLESPFLRLPGELRNRIYELTFLNTVIKRHRYSSWSCDYQSACGLLLVCRQTRYEAAPFLYDAATFDFTCWMYCLRDSLTKKALDAFTRTAVHTIKVNKKESEHIYSGFYWPLDGMVHVQMKGVFPALKYVHTTWDFDVDNESIHDRLQNAVRGFFGKDDIEVHAPLTDDSEVWM